MDFPTSMLWYLRQAGTILTALILGTCSFAGIQDYVELVIPLKDGRFYSRLDFCRSCNTAFKAGYPIEQIPDQLKELTRGELALLKVQELAGWIQEVRIEKDRLILRLPSPENDKAREEMRERLGKVLGMDLQAWPKGKGLLVPSDFDPKKPSILFIAGLGSSSSEAFAGFIQACAKRGIQVLRFDYPNQGPISTSGRRLGGEFNDFTKRYPTATVAVVAHSMGGLVVRYALEVVQVPPGAISDVFLVATPNQGSQLAHRNELLLFVQQRMSKKRADDRLAEGLGEAGVDLRPGSEILKKLATTARPPGVRYHVVLGTKGLVERHELPALEAEFRRFVKRKRLPLEEEECVLKQLSSLYEIVHGLGDGAVTVASARLPGAKTTLTCASNHLDLVEGGGDSPVFRHVLHTLGWPKD